MYVDGFIVPAYRRISKKAGRIWRELGALEYRECAAEDVKMGKKRMVVDV
jgi:uncharacterized protein YbaA (DUF1428 family)